MKCPKCGDARAECVINNFWKCPTCDAPKSRLSDHVNITSRVLRYFHAHGATRFCGWSGSITDSSVRDYAAFEASRSRGAVRPRVPPLPPEPLGLHVYSGPMPTDCAAPLDERCVRLGSMIEPANHVGDTFTVKFEQAGVPSFWRRYLNVYGGDDITCWLQHTIEWPKRNSVDKGYGVMFKIDERRNITYPQIYIAPDL